MSTPQPSMKIWSDAWRNADGRALGDCYAADGIVLHPKQPVVVGRQAIRAFLQGGMGKLDVKFVPHELLVEGPMAFEYGEFTDAELGSGRVLVVGSYAVTWVMRDNRWQIKHHGWNSIS